MPLPLISRLESVRTTTIRKSIHGHVIPYRDKLLPLIYLEDHTTVLRPPDNRAEVKVLVFELEQTVGLVVSEIIDSLELNVTLDDTSITPHGFSGLAVINDQPTAFLDIYQIIEMAYPDWFAKDKEKRAKFAQQKELRVLLAEDSTFYRNMEKSYLMQEGFQVLEAENGRIALEMLKKHPVDLVITDIEMPEMNGFELTEEIRKHPGIKNLPIIAVTSLTSDEERQRGMRAGLDAYLVKLQREQLLSEVHRILTHPTRS